MGIITLAGIDSFIKFRQDICQNYYEIEELKRLYAIESMQDYIRQDYREKPKGRTKKKLRKELYFIYR